ncbi:MAG TPA: hypothetical protein QGF58_08625 [Myxococcota bacterium]|nr:hypothetical protein [Myxococcota bacterium]
MKRTRVVQWIGVIGGLLALIWFGWPRSASLADVGVDFEVPPSWSMEDATVYSYGGVAGLRLEGPGEELLVIHMLTSQQDLNVVEGVSAVSYDLRDQAGASTEISVLGALVEGNLRGSISGYRRVELGTFAMGGGKAGYFDFDHAGGTGSAVFGFMPERKGQVLLVWRGPGYGSEHFDNALDTLTYD